MKGHIWHSVGVAVSSVARVVVAAVMAASASAWTICASAFGCNRMMCTKPYRQGIAEYGCGQCMPCRLNRKRLWTARLMLEQRMHDSSWFVTLTYDDQHLPPSGSVSPREMQLFMKRLREKTGEKLRYYLVGEYGDLTGRPHYHIALFGLPYPLHLQPSEADLRGVTCNCVVCEAWGQGGVSIDDLSAQSAAYIVSYVTKKLTRIGDPRLDGRHPEFARMSLRPGIGAPAMQVVSQVVTSKPGAQAVVRDGDVPSVLKHEKKLWPLGRYLRRKLREESGFTEPGQPPVAAARVALEKQSELLVPGARAAREDKRVQVGRRALVLNSISNSKKGIGL